MHMIIQTFKDFWRQYSMKECANVATMFAVMAPVLLGASGMAIDYSQAYLVQQRLSLAIDSAALAGAASSSDPDEIEQKIFEFFDANYPPEEFGTVFEPEVLVLDDVVQVTARAQHNTTFLKFININEIDIAAETEITLQVRPIEIVFGFDTTGSMGFGSRWDDAMDAVEDLMTTLQEAAGNEFFRAGLVPFGDRVNVGEAFTGFVDMDLVDSPLYTGQNHDREDFNGCVEPREEEIDGNPWRLTDAPPSETLFTPSTEGNMNFLINRNNQYPRCRDEGNMAIVYPTQEIDDIIDRLDSMSPYGTGRIDMGMAWVYRLLSERWKGLFPDFDGPADYDHPFVKKVAVLVTDGNTRAYDFEVNQEVYDGNTDNDPDPDGWGGNNGSAQGFDNLEHVCDQMNANGIDVHMIYLEGNDEILPYMEGCVTVPENLYTVGDEDLDAFQAALDKIKQRTLSLHVSK